MRPEITGRKSGAASVEIAIPAVRGPPALLPIEQRFGVTVPVAAQFVGISRTRIYELLGAGELEGKIIHGRRIVLVKSMMRMIGQAPTAKREAGT